MKKHNINLNKPNWQHVIDNLQMSDWRIAAKLEENGVQYSPSGIAQLRAGNVINPSYAVGRELINLLQEQHSARTGRKPAIIEESRTR